MMTPSPWTHVLCTLVVMAIISHASKTGRSRKIKFPSEECLDYGLDHTMGANIVTGDPSHAGKLSYCALRLRTDPDSVFLVKYNHVKLSCGQKLTVYFSSYESHEHLSQSFNCYSYYNSLPLEYGHYRFLYMKFEQEEVSYNFEIDIVVTSVKDVNIYNTNSCSNENGFLCARSYVNHQQYCANASIKCDGVPNCPNQDDESFCPVVLQDPSWYDDFHDDDDDLETETITGIGFHQAIIVSVVVIGVVMFIVMIIICCVVCRMRRQRRMRRRANRGPNVAVPIRTPPTTAPPPQYPPSQPPSGGGYLPPGGATATAPPLHTMYNTTEATPGGYSTVPTAPPELDLPPSYEEVCGK